MSASGEDDGAGFIEIPLALFTFAVDDSAAVSTPAVTDNIKVKGRGSAEVGFKSQSFFVLMNAAEDPLHGQGSGPKLESDVGVLKAAGRELEAGMKTEAVEPAEFSDTSFASAGRLDPAKGFGAPAAIIGRKEGIPYPESRHCADNVDDKKASHSRLRLPL